VLLGMNDGHYAEYFDDVFTDYSKNMTQLLDEIQKAGATAILITHQLEEAIAVGDRIAVFGQSAKLLADIHVAGWPAADHASLREAIQLTLQNQRPDPRLAAPSRGH